MPRPASWMSCVFPSLEHSTRRVRNLQTILGLTCSTASAARKSAHCLRVAGHTPRTVQTWKDTAFDAGRGTEELPGFYSKESAAAGYIGTLWFPHFLSTAYLLYTFPVAGGFRTRLCRFREPPEYADRPQLTDQYRNRRPTARSVWKAACR